jgi:hypothetical protein
MHPSIVVAVVLIATAPAFADDASWIADARKVAGIVPPKLLAVLTEQVGKVGADGAIAVCREQAPQMAKAASDETGWNIRRVSLRNRNPKAVPDAWERAALEEFDRQAASRANPATLEKAEIVSGGGGSEYRYIKALPAQEFCLQCHGTADRLSPAVQEQLKKLYPDDKAVGYRAGEIRGAITIRKST